jgi:hypothetical protein
MKKSSNTLAQFVLMLFALGWGFFVLGKRPLNIFDTGWLWGDLAQTYVAWVQYHADLSAKWLVSNRMSWPLSMNFSLFDPMPLLLVTIGQLGVFFPKGVQFFGCYFIFCLAMQGLLGYHIVKVLTERAKVAVSEFSLLMAGMFFVIAPFGFHRFQQHTALASQWLILLSIFISLISTPSTLKKWLLLNCSMTLLVAGFNPYLTFMVLISQVGVLLFDRPRHTRIKTVAFKLLALGSTAVLGLYVFGYLEAFGVSNAGYEQYSMNMLGPIDSNGWARILQFDIADPTGSQSFEGFNYQGFGVLVLVVLCLASVFFSNTHRKVALPYQAGLFIIFVSYALALSTKITVSTEVYALDVPQIVKNILGSFRSSGRLFWVGSYWLLVLGLVTILTKLRTRYSLPILGVVLALQIVDVSGVAKQVRQAISTMNRTEYNPTKSEFNVAQYKGLIVIPPWQCATAEHPTPSGDRNQESFGLYAALNNLYTNNFYAARTLDSQARYHCNIDVSLAEISQDNLYIFREYFFNKLDTKIQEKLTCKISQSSNDSFLLCQPK